MILPIGGPIYSSFWDHRNLNDGIKLLFDLFFGLQIDFAGLYSNISVHL